MRRTPLTPAEQNRLAAAGVVTVVALAVIIARWALELALQLHGVR